MDNGSSEPWDCHTPAKIHLAERPNGTARRVGSSLALKLIGGVLPFKPSRGSLSDKKGGGYVLDA